MRTLLFPPKKKTASEKATTLKHVPREEFESSIYRQNEGAPTLLGFPASGVKSALAAAALVTDGISKTDIQKLLYVEGDLLPVWGEPFLRMDVVRSADMARTPDVRTRAFVPEWATTVTISFVQPNLSADSVQSLLVNAGTTIGIGDFRQEKGRGSFGRWRIARMDDPDFLRLRDLHTYGTQKAAMEDAQPFDEQSRELLEFHDSETRQRGLHVA